MTAAMSIRATGPAAQLVRIVIAALLLAAAVSIVGPISHPARVEASTASEMEAYLIKWINDARASRGVPRLKVGTKLTKYAGDRAAKMASQNKLGHPSCLGCELNARDISWNVCSEVVAGTTYPYGYKAAKSLFNAWKGSSGHWSILMSRSYARFGVGVAYRSSNKTTFASAVLVKG